MILNKVDHSISVIYLITNTINRKVYVGQAQNFYDRYYEHKKVRGNGRLQRAFRKYGFDAFRFEIKEPVPDLSCINEREQYWMDFYQSYNPEMGYNVCKEAGTTRGRKRPKEEMAGMIAYRKTLTGDKNHFFGKTHTDEAKQKIRASRLGVKLTPAHIKSFCNSGSEANKKAIYQIDPATGEVVKEYPSIQAASDEIGVSITSIACVLRKYPHRITSGGFKWEYIKKLGLEAKPTTAKTSQKAVSIGCKIIAALLCISSCVNEPKPDVPTRQKSETIYIPLIDSSAYRNDAPVDNVHAVSDLWEKVQAQLDKSISQTNECIKIAEEAQNQRDSLAQLLQVARIWIAVLESNLPDTVSNKSYFRTAKN